MDLYRMDFSLESALQSRTYSIWNRNSTILTLSNELSVLATQISFIGIISVS